LRVAFDAQLAVGTATGIGEYANELLQALRADDQCETIPLRSERLDPWRFDRRVLWDQFALPWKAANSGATLLHAASGTMPLLSKLPVVLTLHDVAWLRVQQHTAPYARLYFGDFMRRCAMRARAIITISQFSAREILQLHPDLDPARLHVTQLGVAADFSSIESGVGDGRSILVLGTVERRKNLEVVIRALPGLPDARVISVGPSTPYRAYCEQLAQQLGVRERVLFRGYLPRSEVLALYAQSAVLAMPSRYEGFGLPVAQARCAGLPVIAARGSSLDELVEDPSQSLAPDDADAWREALARVLADPQRARARAEASRSTAIARFSWMHCARATVEVYRIAST